MSMSIIIGFVCLFFLLSLSLCCCEGASHHTPVHLISSSIACAVPFHTHTHTHTCFLPAACLLLLLLLLLRSPLIVHILRNSTLLPLASVSLASSHLLSLSLSLSLSSAVRCFRLQKHCWSIRSIFHGFSCCVVARISHIRIYRDGPKR